jgi:hypothetical protein
VREAWVGSGSWNSVVARAGQSSSQSHGTITLELKRARGEGCVGRVCEVGSKGLRRDGTGERESSQTESIPWESGRWGGGLPGDREGGVDIGGEGGPGSSECGIVSAGRRRQGKRGDTQSVLMTCTSRGSAGRSSPTRCNGGRRFFIGDRS